MARGVEIAYYEFVYDGHPAEVLKGLQELKSKKHLMDVTLVAEGKEIPCHRAVLSSCSGYFRDMFCNELEETKKDKIEIMGITSEALQLLVDFAYSSKVTITTINAQPLFEAANLLQILPVRDACARFLADHLTPSNCLGVWVLSHTLACEELANRSRAFSLRHFPMICQHDEEFVQLPGDLLKMYISDDYLNAQEEEQVFEMVMKWVKHDLRQRKKFLKEVVEDIRFPHMDQIYLMRSVEADEVVMKVPGIRDILHEARMYHISRGEVSSPRTRPRLAYGLHEAMVVLGGTRVVNGEYNNDVYCFVPAYSQWSKLTSLPKDLKNTVEYAATTLNNDIVITGGYWSPTAAWLYSTQFNTWNKLPPLSVGRFRHKMATLDGRVYVLGGKNPRGSLQVLPSLDSVEIYDPPSNTWKPSVPLLKGVRACAIATCEGKMYVIGGKDTDQTATDAVQCYDPVQKRWSFRTPMPMAESCFSATSVNALIYAVGGRFQAIQCYDPNTDRWQELAQSLAPWDYCSVTTCDNKLYVTGGRVEDKVKKGKDTVQCYDPANDLIELVHPMPVKLFAHCAVTILKRRRQADSQLVAAQRSSTTKCFY
ncbi:kelch-like protein 24 isoform X1 [Branchiostoma lanceolatum]